MKLLIIGDGHLSNQKPQNRKDANYLETLIDKLNQIIDIYYAENCDQIIQVGDLFDSPCVSYEVTAAAIKTLRKVNKPILMVYGQHDIFSHAASTLPKSPLSVLQAYNLVKVIDASGYRIDDVAFYGASFGQPIPIVDKTDKFNVLIHHGMIGSKDLYPGQNIMKPDTFLKQYDCYDMIAVGDYHWAFDCRIGNRVILNSGCIVRKSIADNDLNHLPGIYTFDTFSSEYKRILLNIAPIDSIFNLDNKHEKENVNETIVELIKNISDKRNSTISWQHLLYDYLKEKDIPTEIVNWIEKAIGEVKCQTKQ